MSRQPLDDLPDARLGPALRVLRCLAGAQLGAVYAAHTMPAIRDLEAAGLVMVSPLASGHWHVRRVRPRVRR